MTPTTFTPTQALAVLLTVVATLFIIFTAVHLYRSHTAPHHRPHSKAPTPTSINPPRPTTTQQLQQQNKQLNNIFWLVLLSMFRKK